MNLGSKPFRFAVGALTLSAVGFVATLDREGYTDRAIIPTKNDRPTVGFGSTFREDGSPVQTGDTITPPRAARRALAHIQKDELGLKRCIPPATLMSQAEWDILVDFAYQYGVARTCQSSMVRHTIAGDYEAACRSYRAYKFAGGYDCSLPANSRICGGVWTGSLEREQKCLAAQ